MSFSLIDADPYLKDFEGDINLRMQNYARVRKNLLGAKKSLLDISENHKYYGFHQADGGWYYRENAPGADEMYLVGDFNGWDRFTHRMKRRKNGDFEIFLPGKDALKNGQNIQTLVYSHGKALERIPVYADYVVQDAETHQWCAQLFIPDKKYHWKKRSFHPQKPLLIYECHIGMAQDKFGVGTYKEFTENVLPRVAKLGYNTIQIMAIAEHPYYGSFGYQVSNFFAASSRFGTPDDLRELIDTAHELGIAVLLDVVHSHLVKNTREGIAEFDGTDYQFSPHGAKGNHPAWGTRLFDYAKPEVLRFLLSNLRYWMEEYHFDGFRFDGVVCGSMEGFLQSLKLQDINKQRQICSMKGKNAKKQTSTVWQTDQIVWWKGKAIDRQSGEFTALVRKAYNAMFEQSERFRTALMATRGMILYHTKGEGNPYKTILTEQEFCSILTELRENYDHRDKTQELISKSVQHEPKA